MTQYRLLVHRDVLHYLRTLERAAATQQPGGLRDRELRALKAGLRAIANGEEEHFEGKRLGFTTHDLSDCAEIKLPVIPESRGNRELGSSHRLLYREFEPEDGGPPYREVVCFEHRGGNRPFDVAAKRLGRAVGVRRQTLHALGASSDIAPVRQPLPPDLRKALAAASGVAPARGAVTAQQSPGRLASRKDDRPPGREI
ncbi:hypothetical protein AB0E63_36900 [Kribbella sp. NPDC026596]|uniref:hypothetical protein n=1 Tax=Kribbella sp. NPDC026596 TaxID=3155122 RepID=UPI0033EDF25C